MVPCTKRLMGLMFLSVGRLALLPTITFQLIPHYSHVEKGIMLAYAWLCKHYKDGDKIFLFG